MLTGHELLTVFDERTHGEVLGSTGLVELESLTGGMREGRVWVVTGHPGQGKTTLLTQCAVAVARGGSRLVDLVTPRDPAALIVARLLAQTGMLPLHRLSGENSDDLHNSWHARTRARIEALPLCLFASGQATYVPEVDPVREPIPASVLIDDADLVAGLTPTLVADWAASERFVAVSLPHNQVVSGPGEEADLDPGWARVADAIIDVRLRGLPTRPGQLRPGEADFIVRHNRWGYTGTVHALHQAHFSRFVEADT